MELLKQMYDYYGRAFVAEYLGEKGQGIVEYALILAFVVALAIVLTQNDGVKGGIQNTFGNVTNTLANS